MITNLHIENFRSIEKASVDLGRITALTGANNSGKTSIMHALMTMRNIYTNPNRTVDEFLVINNVNLGGFKEVVFRKDEKKGIGVKLSTYTAKGEGSDQIILNSNSMKINSFFGINNTISEIEFTLPYAINKTVDLTLDNRPFSWNGFVLKNKESQEEGASWRAVYLSKTDAMGPVRNFTKPFYNPTNIVSLQTEDELATQLSIDRDLESRVARYLRRITGSLHLSVRHTAHIAQFRIQIQDLDNPSAPLTDLVNEGLGIHHLVVILIKALRKETKVLCIDEPELHLHPSMIHRLVEALAEIAVEEDKQFIVATHSEHFLSAMLNCVIKKQLKPEEAAIHYVHKHQGITQVDRQDVNAKGQLKGGMRTFYEAELSQLDTLLAAED